MSARYAIGIDLGTTHSAIAYAAIDETDASATLVHELPIPQTVAPFEVADRSLLPSFLYLTDDANEFGAGALALPWSEHVRDPVGELALRHGVSVPGRLVASAKSWLSHPDVDRRAPLLPLAAADEAVQGPGSGPGKDAPRRISPVDASFRYLEHVKHAWDHRFPDAPFAAQEVTLTVPASFDPAARELTAEAATRAGAHELVLLEEPQAALYAFLADHRGRFEGALAVGDVILVVDVGGGTTDLSLIAITEREGVLEPHRVAVGEHILLGGDNMDLALAAAVERKLVAEGRAIDDWQRRALVHACRVAKERLFATEPARVDGASGANPAGPDVEVPIVIPGRGGKLVGGSIRSTLGRDEAHALLVEGFFPRVVSSTKPIVRARAALTSIGLPYAQDAAVTRHLAAFVSRHAYATKDLPGFEAHAARTARFLHPTAILFNGGVFKSPAFTERIGAVVAEWLASDGAPPMRVLEGADLDRAVARGAAYYGLVRTRGGVRIRGGLAQSFYVGVESTMPAIPGMEPPVHAVCVAPFGLEEGAKSEPLANELGLVVGEPVRFRFFASSSRRDDRVGTTLVHWTDDELTELGAIEVTLPAAGRREGDVVPVRLEAQVTEVGTLELAARPSRGLASEGSGLETRWKVALDVRS